MSDAKKDTASRLEQSLKTIWSLKKIWCLNLNFDIGDNFSSNNNHTLDGNNSNSSSEQPKVGREDQAKSSGKRD